jgi:gamma-glutamyltranspeptidase/glutathione hydrolase
MAFVHRPAVLARGGLVVAGHHFAAEAGAAVLREGGNAMDAAVAAAATLAVAIPFMNGLGGDCFVLWHDAKRGASFAINGSGAAPFAATPEAYRKAGHESVPSHGPLSISTPGAVHAWARCLKLYGSIDVAGAIRPALELAEAGLPLDRLLRDYLNGENYALRVKAHAPLAGLYGAPGGRRLGETVRLPALAATLRTLHAKGPCALYGGEIGKALAADMARAGSVLTNDDLAAHDTLIQAPLSVAYRGHEILASPPNTQGIALLATLGVLERLPPGPALPRFMRAKLAAFALRDKHLGDPSLAPVPPDALTPAGLDALARGAPARAPATKPVGGDTSTLVVVDRWGNAVAWVQSLFDAFGSGIASPETGLVMQNRLSMCSLDGNGPARLVPGKRTPHTLAPALILERGTLRAAMTTPGDHGQPQSLAQIAVNLIDHGMDPQEAIEAPRIRHDEANIVMHESRVDAADLAPLVEAGFTLADVGPWSRLMGGACAIWRQDDGLLIGGADPRRAPYAVAA